MTVTAATKVPTKAQPKTWKASREQRVFMCDRCGKEPAAEGWDGYCVGCGCVYEAGRKIEQGQRLIEEGKRALVLLAEEGIK